MINCIVKFFAEMRVFQEGRVSWPLVVKNRIKFTGSEISSIVGANSILL